MVRLTKHLLLPLLLSVACLYTYKLEIPETRDWPASGITSISASTRSGHINVAASGSASIAATITRYCYGRNEADAKEAIENVVVKDTIEGSELNLWAEMPGGRRSYGAYYDITAPDSVSLVLSTSNGSITLAGMTGGAHASTSNGDVNLLNTAGDMDLVTSNGGVAVQVHRGGISISTSNGAIECDLAELGPTESATLVTSNGKVTLCLPAGVSASFDAETSNGDIAITGFGYVEYEVSERTHKRGLIGSGSSSVTIATSNGDILIRARQ